MSRITLTSVAGSLDLFGTDTNGCSWTGEDLTGWGSTGTTLTVTQKQAADGGWRGPSFKKPRIIGVSGAFQGSSPAAAVASLDLLNAILAAGPTITVDEGAGARTAVVLQQDEVIPGWVNDFSCKYSFQMVAPDPRKFGADITSLTSLPSSTGGLTWPITFPVTWTGVTNSGVVSIPNLGNTYAPVRLRISGPVTGPIVTHLGSGQQLVFATSLSLGSGEWLDVDMEARTVLAQGQSSRNGYVTSRGWFSADPGTNEYGFQASVYDPSSELSVTVPSGAWL